MRDFNYIFGIGPSKSGTHSLWEALNTLGVRCLHFGNDHYLTTQKQPDAIASSLKAHKNIEKKLPFLTGIPEYDAYIDWPVHEIDPAVLDKQYPDSLFILTYRNPDDVALSMARMWLTFQRDKKHSTNYEYYADRARRIYTRALTFAASLPDRFLIIDTCVPGAVNTKKLAKFLDIPACDKKWPHGFNHQDWYQKDA